MDDDNTGDGCTVSPTSKKPVLKVSSQSVEELDSFYKELGQCSKKGEA